MHRYRERPAEELYDLSSDPYELNNLAENADHAETLSELRQKLDAWMQTTGDEQKFQGKPLLLTGHFR